MAVTVDDLSRIQKLFVDRHGMSLAEAEAKLNGHKIHIVCGPEVAGSPTLQAALLTAANIASRCFPKGAVVHLADHDTPLALRWRSGGTLGSALRESCASVTISREPAPDDSTSVLVLGSNSAQQFGLQLTFDGWSAAVGPLTDAKRLPESEGCLLAGVAGAALALGELFLEFSGLNLAATRREVGVSLWRPDLPWSAHEARGPRLQFLPGEWWSLGLGHLGQAYLWSLGLLPYSDPCNVRVLLNDPDRIVKANVDTGLLTLPAHLGRLKTSVCERWLDERGFICKRLDRLFDCGIVRYDAEPALAFCGFDAGGPRHFLDEAGFQYVVECGLGGRADNFDSLDLHTLPHPSKKAKEIWPPQNGDGDDAHARELAENNIVYQQMKTDEGCGHVELASRAIGVPFVGAFAASLAIAEVLRMLHDGERYLSISTSFDEPGRISARRFENGYRGRNLPRILHCPVVAPPPKP